jgi:CHAD domain-containing protein/inorganic triphosphatase YgiF
MEIESKFLVIDEADFRDLEKLSRLGDYSLSETVVQPVEDVFLDTEDMAIMASGYYLRMRKDVGKEGHWVTVKSLGGFEGGAHKREEHVSFLPEGLSLLECPDAGIRNRIFELSAGFDLGPILKLKQKRAIRQVKLGERHVAELSLDRVELKSENRKKTYSELEVELKSGGTSEDLAAISKYLIENYDLSWSPFSKFERALLFAENLPDKTLLTHQERAVCMQLKGHRNIYGKQAGILLELDRGKSSSELSLLFKIPEPEIETLNLKFEKERLSFFPFATDEAADRELHFNPGSGTLDQGWEAMGFEEWTPEALFERYSVDEAKAKKVRDAALTLFDGLSPYHGLEAGERELLALATLMKDIGISVSGEEKARMGKEILLSHPLKGLQLRSLRMLALITELQDPGVSEKTLGQALKGAHIRLPPGLQNKALVLAAFIRIADLLETQASPVRPGKIRQLEDALEIELIGPDAEKAGKKAAKRSELWEYLFGTKLWFTPTEESHEPQTEEEKEGAKEKVGEKREKAEKEREAAKEKKKGKASKKFTVKPGDSMGEVAHRIFSYQFGQMLSHEKGTRKGENIEELHDMRVAVRRMRAASKVFKTYLDSEQLGPHLKGLRRTQGALGDVRDLDVFREKAKEYLETLPEGHEQDLAPLFAMLGEEREKARKTMLAYLDSEKYARSKRDFSEFLEVPGAGALPTSNKKHDALPHRVKDVLPSVIYARFADIGAYSEWVEGPYVSVERLHRLRIAAKGLRYTFEFFEDVLGDNAKIMIKEFKGLQDHLGDLHDAVVAIDLLSSYLRTGAWGLAESETGKKAGKQANLKGMEGIEIYLASREEELRTLLDTFPDAWAKFRSKEFREKIEEAIENL